MPLKCDARGFDVPAESKQSHDPPGNVIQTAIRQNHIGVLRHVMPSIKRFLQIYREAVGVGLVGRGRGEESLPAVLAPHCRSRRRSLHADIG